VEKRTVRMGPALATPTEALIIKHHLVNINRKFSPYAIEAVLEKMEREAMAEEKKVAA